MAVERLVLKKGSPVELLPRSAPVLRLQSELIQSYGLDMERVGEEPNCRLRILPRGVEGGVGWGEVGGVRSDGEEEKEGEDAMVESDTGAGMSVNRLPVLEDF